MTEENPIPDYTNTIQSEEPVPIERERISTKYNFTLTEKVLFCFGILFFILLVFVNYLKIVE